MCVRKEGISSITFVSSTQLEYADDLWITITSQTGLTISICVCYHPPKPIYDSEALENQTIKNFEHLIHTTANDVYILKDDLNQMDSSMFELDLGFVQLVKDPTHKTNILDKFLTNRPHLFDVQVNCDKTTSNGDKTVKPRTTIDVRVYSPVVGKLLCQSLCNYNWSAIVNAIDAQSDTINAIYDDFVKIVKWHVGQIVPLHKVIMRESE